MTLTQGSRVGSYEIVAPLGAGGMGEVYRARDTKLQRDVALKILPETFASDPERVARFEREARTLASLNHPHIAQVHGFEHDAGTHALVMELVDGEDLAERIARGAISIDDALPIARQIAEALEAAHEQGIIHRDLKPANIKIRADGTVKVLDFGLAKALGATGATGTTGAGALGAGATLTSPAMTMQGMILGTAAYMSPEQAKGKPADKRSDIWAFGCVLYEMLTGARAFEGEDITDTIVAVMSKEPDWSRLPGAIPPPLHRLLRRTLEKKAVQRLPDIGVARLEIDEALAWPSTRSSSDATQPAAQVTRSVRWQMIALFLIVGTVIGGVTVALAGRYLRSTPPSTPTRLHAKVASDVTLSFAPNTTMGATVVLSPDGTMVAFVAQKDKESSQLYVRRLDRLDAIPVAGTENARGPFFAPSGQWIAFFADGKLKKVAVSGGAAVTLADAPDPRGGTWGDDDVIIFAATALEGLSRVSSASGAVEILTRLAEGEVTHRWPHALPGSKAIFYETHSSRTNHDNGTIVLQPLPGGERKMLHRGGYDARYLGSGHLAYIHEGALFVIPFDLGRLEITGGPIPVLPGISSSATSGWAQFSVSNAGTLVYVPGGSTNNTAPIEWVNQRGEVTPLRSERTSWGAPAFSPDGRFLAMSILDGQRSNIWVYDIARGVPSRATFSGAVRAIWTPDGKRLTYSRLEGATQNLYSQPADGSSDAERLTDTPMTQFAASWHPNGKHLAVIENKVSAPPDIVVWSTIESASGQKLGQPTPFANSSFPELDATFSPDGRWLAYSSLESGTRFEVYVKPFPGPGGKFQVSTDGGTAPTWSRTSNELLYLSPQRQVMVASYTTEGGAFRLEKSRLWADVVVAVRPLGGISFALHPDGKRIAFARAPESELTTPQDHVVFVFNFFDELRRLTASKQ